MPVPTADLSLEEYPEPELDEALALDAEARGAPPGTMVFARPCFGVGYLPHVLIENVTLCPDAVLALLAGLLADYYDRFGMEPDP